MPGRVERRIHLPGLVCDPLPRPVTSRKELLRQVSRELGLSAPDSGIDLVANFQSAFKESQFAVNALIKVQGGYTVSAGQDGQLAEEVPTDAAAFVEKCGTHLVTGIRHGARFLMLMSVEAQSVEARKQLEASLASNVIPSFGTGATVSRLNAATDQSVVVNITAWADGFGPNQRANGRQDLYRTAVLLRIWRKGEGTLPSLNETNGSTVPDHTAPDLGENLSMAELANVFSNASRVHAALTASLSDDMIAQTANYSDIDAVANAPILSAPIEVQIAPYLHDQENTKKILASSTNAQDRVKELNDLIQELDTSVTILNHFLAQSERERRQYQIAIDPQDTLAALEAEAETYKENFENLRAFLVDWRNTCFALGRFNLFEACTAATRNLTNNQLISLYRRKNDLSLSDDNVIVEFDALENEARNLLRGYWTNPIRKIHPIVNPEVRQGKAERICDNGLRLLTPSQIDQVRLFPAIAHEKKPIWANDGVAYDIIRRHDSEKPGIAQNLVAKKALAVCVPVDGGLFP